MALGGEAGQNQAYIPYPAERVVKREDYYQCLRLQLNTQKEKFPYIKDIVHFPEQAIQLVYSISYFY